MSEFGEILANLAEALGLERELGERTVECDRSLLVSPTVVTTPPSLAVTLAPKTPVPQAVIPAQAPVALPPKQPIAIHPEEANTPTIQTSNIPPVPRFAFVVETPDVLEGPSGELLDKMLHAIKLSRQDVILRVMDAGVREKLIAISPAVIILFGKNLINAFVPNKGLQPNEWITLNSIHVCATWSPLYISNLEKRNSPLLRRYKMDVWTILRDAVRQSKL